MAKPVRMTNGTRTFDVPEDRVADAEARGFHRDVTPQNAATAPAAVAAKEARTPAVVPSQVDQAMAGLTAAVAPGLAHSAAMGGQPIQQLAAAIPAAAGHFANTTLQGFLPHAAALADMAASRAGLTTPTQGDFRSRLMQYRQRLENEGKLAPEAAAGGTAASLAPQVALGALAPVPGGVPARLALAGLEGGTLGGLQSASQVNDLSPESQRQVAGNALLNAGVSTATAGLAPRLGPVMRPLAGAAGGFMAGAGGQALAEQDPLSQGALLREGMAGAVPAALGGGLAAGGEGLGALGRRMIPPEMITQQRLAAAGMNANELQQLEQMLGQRPIEPMGRVPGVYPPQQPPPPLPMEAPPTPAPRPVAPPSPASTIGHDPTQLAPVPRDTEVMPGGPTEVNPATLYEPTPTRRTEYVPIADELQQAIAKMDPKGLLRAQDAMPRGNSEPTRVAPYVPMREAVAQGMERLAPTPRQPSEEARIHAINQDIQAAHETPPEGLEPRDWTEQRLAERERTAAEHVPTGNQAPPRRPEPSAAPAVPSSPGATPPPSPGAAPSRPRSPTISPRPTMAQEAQQAIYKHDIQGGLFTSAREMARRARTAATPLGEAIGEHVRELARRQGGHVTTYGETIGHAPERLTGMHGLTSPQESERTPAMTVANEMRNEFGPEGGLEPDGYRHALDYFGKKARAAYSPNSGVSPDAAELAASARQAFRAAADAATQRTMGDSALAADRARHAEHGALTHLEEAASRASAQGATSTPAVGRFAAARHLGRKFHYTVARLGEAAHGMHGTHIGTGSLGTFADAARRLLTNPAVTTRVLSPVSHFIQSETDEDYRRAQRERGE